MSPTVWGPRKTAAAAVIAGLCLASCGGPIENAELKRGIATLKATAQEGRLLGFEVGRHHPKETFVRVHSGALADVCTHEAEKLSDAPAKGANTPVKAAAVKLAQDIGSALGDLQVTPGDGATGAQVAAKLRKLAQTADGLEAKL